MQTRPAHLSWLAGLCLTALALTSLVVLRPAQPAAAQTRRLLIPIGGGYADIYAGFSQAAITNARGSAVNILVLPMPYSSNSQQISEAERATNLRDAEERRFQIEEACQRAAPATLTCSASLAPVFVRADAADPDNLAYFDADLAAIFILGGDQTVAMQTIAGTPLEAAITAAYEKGVILAGTSAGGGMLSRPMLAGYRDNYAAGNALDFGAVDVWNTDERHGLPSGLPHAMLDQHFYQRGRIGRLLNAISLPEAPHVGVGVDAYTGVLAPEGKRLEGVFGLYTVTVLDAETFHAAEGVRYVESGGRVLLSLRNVVVNLLSPGDFGYDLPARQFDDFGGAAAPGALPSRVERTFEGLQPPAGAGTLFLSGNLSASLSPQNPVLQSFLRACGPSPRILLFADGYPSGASAERAAQAYAKALPEANVTIVFSDPKSATPPVLPEASAYDAVMLVGKDQSKLTLAYLEGWVKAAWLAGKPILADNAMTAAVGMYYSAHGPVPEDAEEAELATQKSFRLGKTQVEAGLGLVGVNLEPQVLADNRWGRVFSLAYTHPEQIVLGLSDNTAIEIGPQGASVIGENVAFALDARQAALALGEADGFVIANALLDVFAPGETLQPTIAEADAAPQRQPTPHLPTPAPTLTSTPLPSATPSAAPTAAPTSPAVSPAGSPALPWLLGGAAGLVGILLLGLWLARRQRE